MLHFINPLVIGCSQIIITHIEHDFKPGIVSHGLCQVGHNIAIEFNRKARTFMPEIPFLKYPVSKSMAGLILAILKRIMNVIICRGNKNGGDSRLKWIEKRSFAQRVGTVA